MEIKLKLGRRKVTKEDLIKQINESAKKLPYENEYERKLVNEYLENLSHTHVIDLINITRDWWYNGKYSKEGETKKPRSCLFYLHKDLEQLEKIIKSEELVEEILKIVPQLPNSDERDGIINTFKNEEINEENLKLASDRLQAWLDCEEVGEFSEKEQDYLSQIESIIDDLLEIFKEN